MLQIAFFRFKTRNNEDIYKILAKHDKKSCYHSQLWSVYWKFSGLRIWKEKKNFEVRENDNEILE